MLVLLDKAHSTQMYAWSTIYTKLLCSKAIYVQVVAFLPQVHWVWEGMKDVSRVDTAISLGGGKCV